MFAPRIRGALSFALVAAAAACGNGGTEPNNNGKYTLGLQCNGTAALAVGVPTPVPESAACLGGGASGAEYVATAFLGTTDSTASIPATFNGIDLDAVSGPAPTLLPSAQPSLSLTPGMASEGRGPLGDQLDAMLRERERRVLTPMMGAAREYRRTHALPSSNGGLHLAVTPGVPNVGDVLTFNTSLTACSAAKNISARVVAITNRAIIVADVDNPANGFTDAEYANVGTMFDTLVAPIDEGAFGTPSDIDANGGRIYLLFTKEVNKLTPAGSQSYVGGFFYSRDLFPTTGTSGFACATSNYAEMFYLLVPDVTGALGNVFTKAKVIQNTVGTTGHEYQHLINSATKLYVTDAPYFEDTWLDEGLAHIAEELLFYHASGLSPRQNIDSTTISASQQRVDAYNNYLASNFGRLLAYIKKPSIYGPYAPNDSLETRGAIWSALRYLTDRKNGNDLAIWQSLVHTSVKGIPNLRAVYGADVISQLRDWSVALETDDLVPTDPNYQIRSYNYRSIYYRLLRVPYQLVRQPLSGNGTVSQQMKASGSAYIRFRVPAGQTATFWWNPAVTANGLQLTVVRTE